VYEDRKARVLHRPSMMRPIQTTPDEAWAEVIGLAT
jgi:hypothetical protein